MPVVSIIIPVYNGEKYIEKCLASVLNQTFEDYEVIIIDDGSTDNSKALCEKISQQSKKIKMIYKVNEGVTKARNAGLLEARGEYITFVDIDDWVEENYLQRLVEVLQENSADIVASGCIRELPSRSENQINLLEPGVYEGLQMKELYTKMLYHSVFFSFGIQPYLWNKIFKRSIILEAVKDIDDKIYDGEDVAIVCSALLRAQKVVIIEDCLYHYVYYPFSASNQKGTDFYENVSRLYCSLNACFKKTPYYDILLPQLDQYFRMMVWQKKPEKYITPKYIFPFQKIEPGTDIVLYGAGYVGKQLYNQVMLSNYCNLVAWVDRNYGINDIISLDELEKMTYDYIVIAIADETVCQTVAKELMTRGIKEEQIIMIIR